MNKDIFYVGTIVALILAVIFVANMFYTVRMNYTNYKDTCDAKMNYVVTHFTNISSIYNYTSKVISYSNYLEKKDTRPCNCTSFNSTTFSIKIDDKTHMELSREVWCNNTHYYEIISFNYLAPMLKNWSEYTPSEFCIHAS